ncbi:MAG: transposase [Candidatus Acidiferrales bacterium]
MRKSRFEAKDVVKLLDEAAIGVPVREICIRAGISEATFYNWKTTYEGLDAKGIRRLRELEQENSRLRRALSVKNLQIDVLKAQLEHT